MRSGGEDSWYGRVSGHFSQRIRSVKAYDLNLVLGLSFTVRKVWSREEGLGRMGWLGSESGAASTAC